MDFLFQFAKEWWWALLLALAVFAVLILFGMFRGIEGGLARRRRLTYRRRPHRNDTDLVAHDFDRESLKTPGGVRVSVEEFLGAFGYVSLGEPACPETAELAFEDPPSGRFDTDVLPAPPLKAGTRPLQEPTLRERLGPPDFKRAPSETAPRGAVLWFATDRSQASSGVVGFTGDRANGRLPMSYGTAYVTLPPKHVTGRIEQRRFWQIFADPDDARRFVVIHPPQLLSVGRFWDDVSGHVRESSRRDVLVFVHGYNVSFDAGLKRLAQITVDLGFEGAPLLYSWPSGSQARKYGVDAATIRWTAPHLEAFLRDVIAHTLADRIYLLAHSLGNDALTSVLQLLRRTLPHTPAPLFRQVVLAAPDVDAGAFEITATEITPLAHLVSLYASQTDRALSLSGSVVHKYPRAGSVTGGLVVVPPMETIDATGVDSSFLKHSYFGSTDPLLGDLHQLLLTDTRAGMSR
jgi:esterase/lipase superfamily enzyme